MKPRDPGGITVELIGGLGNQLFQYATGLAQARRLKCPLTLDVTYFTVTDKRSFALDSFAHEGSLAWDTGTHKGRAARLLQGRVPSAREQSFSYDPQINQVPLGTRLEGYFQSWRYFDAIGPDLRQQINSLTEASLWFEHMRVELCREPWIGVHIRRGDYASQRYRDTFGPVSTTYVSRALKHLRMCSEEMRVVVFTDDPTGVSQELSQAGMPDLANSVLVPPQGADALESLLLLSACDHLVMSNSSFSWWAGYLGDRGDRMVVAPRPWFIGLEHDTRDLLPPHWLTLDSRDFVMPDQSSPGESGPE